MKKKSEIMKRVRTLLCQELDRRVEESRRRFPSRCLYNQQQPLDDQPKVDGLPNPGYNRVDRTGLPVVKTMGFCMKGVEDPTEWSGTICEDYSDGDHCPWFTPRQSKEELLAEFKTQLQDETWICVNLPAVYELLWVLGDSPANYHLPWWKRVWFYFLEIRIEPVREVPDLSKLLGG
jgi:hypothetical protein